MRAKLLTKQENKLVEDLGKAWNKFLLLEELHPTERVEFMHSIHRLQHMIMARPVQREFLKD
jgi:hypothetical protein